MCLKNFLCAHGPSKSVTIFKFYLSLKTYLCSWAKGYLNDFYKTFEKFADAQPDILTLDFNRIFLIICNNAVFATTGREIDASVDVALEKFNKKIPGAESVKKKLKVF